MYNKHHKSANESRKYRDSGETRTLALRMLGENKEKHYKAVAAALAGGQAYMPKAAQKAKSPAVRPEPIGIKKERSEEFYDLAPGAVPMSISEKIKAEGRKRKAPPIDTPSSQQGTPAPSTSQKLSSPAPKSGSPAPTKMDNPPLPKKKGTAAPVKKPAPKRPRSEGLPVQCPQVFQPTNNLQQRKTAHLQVPFASRQLAAPRAMMVGNIVYVVDQMIIA